MQRHANKREGYSASINRYTNPNKKGCIAMDAALLGICLKIPGISPKESEP